MISIEEAIEILVENINESTETELVNERNFVGRVLAQDIISNHSNPPFNRSPLDGYAVRGEDTTDASKEAPAKLKVVGKVYAGQHFDGILSANEAVRIMTGAMIPQGANAVIRQEDTDYGEVLVNIYKGVKPYDNYCYEGEDYKKGDKLILNNTYINAQVSSVLASLAVTDASVYKQPQIGVISTGDELLEPGMELVPGKIYDSNLIYIRNRLNELGIPAAFSMHCGDDAMILANFIRDNAKTCPLIITTGGVSVGEKDILHDVVKELDAQQLFWKVKVKPGSPTLAFKYEDTLVICLSGNPYGAIANFEILVRPVLSKLTRRKDILPEISRAVLNGEIKKTGGTRRLVRGSYENGEVVPVNGNHSQGALASITATNCLIDLEDENKKYLVGDMVRIIRI